LAHTVHPHEGVANEHYWLIHFWHLSGWELYELVRLYAEYGVGLEEDDYFWNPDGLMKRVLVYQYETFT
jgi:hypothetical protein